MGRKIIKRYIFGSLVFLVLLVIILNVFVMKNKDFWDASVTSCLTLLVALVVSYYFSQKNLDERRQKETYLKLLEKVQRLVSDKDLVEIRTSADIEVVLMKKRELNNYVYILKKYAEKFSLKEDIKFIEEKTQEYTDFLGNHQQDVEYLKKSSNELARPLLLIDSRLSEIMIKLFE